MMARCGASSVFMLIESYSMDCGAINYWCMLYAWIEDSDIFFVIIHYFISMSISLAYHKNSPTEV